MMEPKETVQLIEPMNAAATRVRLKELLSKVWTDRWRKAPTQERQPPPHKGKRCHSSAFRLIATARSKPPKPAAKKKAK